MSSENTYILAVDDEIEMLQNYTRILSGAGYNVLTAKSGAEALQVLKDESTVILAICDLNMPGMDGLSLLGEIKRHYPYLPVIMVTGYGTLEQGIKAVKAGVYDFIEKPFSKDKLLKTIAKALKDIQPPETSGETASGFDDMIGKSPAILEIFDLIKRVSFGNANVMVTGESGVGKELVVRSIHKNSMRRNHPLIPVNCGALPASLFESELFGYEKGAFTGAFQSKPGLVELANGGTLFLDEICEMPMELQVKLLRMLEDRKIRRIGGSTEIPVDVRVITATNKDPQLSVENEQLREDLYFRINTIRIHVPPLRERGDDVILLANHFLNRLNAKYNRNIYNIDKEAQDRLRSYHWPGNVRELLNVVEHAYYLAQPPTIRCKDLPQQLRALQPHLHIHSWDNLKYKEAKEKVLEEFEREYLQYHLERNDWNISRTAEACEIDRRTIHRILNKIEIKKN